MEQIPSIAAKQRARFIGPLYEKLIIQQFLSEIDFRR
jgi:hypothetical protein